MLTEQIALFRGKSQRLLGILCESVPKQSLSEVSMPRHTFRFPEHIRAAVRRHVDLAIASLEATRYGQEPNYTAALARAIHCTAYDDSDRPVIFTAIPMDDRARKSAESIFGADLATTAEITGNGDHIRKAIMIQAKFGTVDELNSKAKEFLDGQIRKMPKVTTSPKVMEIPLDGKVRAPRIASGNRVVENKSFRPIQLSKYFTPRVLTTLDGDT